MVSWLNHRQYPDMGSNTCPIRVSGTVTSNLFNYLCDFFLCIYWSVLTWTLRETSRHISRVLFFCWSFWYSALWTVVALFPWTLTFVFSTLRIYMFFLGSLSLHHSLESSRTALELILFVSFLSGILVLCFPMSCVLETFIYIFC